MLVCSLGLAPCSLGRPLGLAEPVWLVFRRIWTLNSEQEGLGPVLHLASSKSHQSWLREACRKVGAREYDYERVGPTVTQQEEVP